MMIVCELIRFLSKMFVDDDCDLCMEVEMPDM